MFWRLAWFPFPQYVKYALFKGLSGTYCRNTSETPRQRGFTIVLFLFTVLWKPAVILLERPLCPEETQRERP